MFDKERSTHEVVTAGVLAAVVGSGAASIIILTRKSAMDLLARKQYSHVVVDVHICPWGVADSGASSRERIGAAVRPVGKVLDRRQGAWRSNRGYVFWWVRLLWAGMVEGDGVVQIWGLKWSVAKGGTRGKRLVIPTATWVGHAP
jgi:hypothetical protein